MYTIRKEGKFEFTAEEDAMMVINGYIKFVQEDGKRQCYYVNGHSMKITKHKAYNIVSRTELKEDIFTF